MRSRSTISYLLVFCCHVAELAKISTLPVSPVFGTELNCIIDSSWVFLSKDIVALNTLITRTLAHYWHSLLLTNFVDASVPLAALPVACNYLKERTTNLSRDILVKGVCGDLSGVCDRPCVDAIGAWPLVSQGYFSPGKESYAVNSVWIRLGLRLLSFIAGESTSFTMNW